MTIAIRLAETEAEHAALYAFRYRIYVDEMSRPQKCANHKARQIRDPLDENGYNLIAWAGNEIAGCVRVNFARDGGLEYYRALLQMDSVGEAWPHAVSLCTRLMIAPCWRSSTLAVRLSVKAFELGQRGGIHWNFIDCNAHLVGFFERMGYVTTHRAVHAEYGEVYAMRFNLLDLEQLANPGSPFRRSLDRWLDERESVCRAALRKPRRHPNTPPAHAAVVVRAPLRLQERWR